MEAAMGQARLKAKMGEAEVVKPGQKIPMVDVFLWGPVPLRVRVPLSEARKQLGAAGCYFNTPAPLKQMFGLGLGGFFAVFLGFYAWLFYQALAPITIWGVVGFAAGGIGGWILGMAFARMGMTLAYVAWTKWDPEKKERVIQPIGHHSVEMTMEPKHREAFLTAIGEAVPKPRRPAWSQGEAKETTPPEESALTSHIIATYSTKKLYGSMQAKVQKRMLSGHRTAEKMLQYASLGSIALALILVAALVTLVFASDDGGGSSPPRATQEQIKKASDAK